jgi:N-alpha-acetyl-L-2,4-diaminobutyrate deacetylase
MNSLSSTRRIVRPAQLDLDSPGRRDYWVALEHDTLWGDHLVPLSVWVGDQAREGQGLVAFGSTHGNEYEGPVALKHLLHEIKIEDVRGRIILVPVLNMPAFKSGTRETVTEDGVNLNRAFVEGAGTNPAIAGITHRIARFVREYIWPRVHVVLDLHSGGTSMEFAPCASFHPIDDEEQSRLIEDTARWFGTPAVMTYQNQTPGLLPSEAERLGKITVGTELGWGEACLRTGVLYARQGVLAAAIHHGQLNGKIEPIAHHADGTQHRVEIVARECFCPAPFAGHFEPLRDCGDLVKEGEAIGLLHDFDHIDAAAFEVRAALDGMLLVHAWKSSVLQGQHVAVVGSVVW